MPDVHRIGFTQLSGNKGARDGPYRTNIIFVHGLRGHPRKTWEDDRGGSSEDVGNAASSKRTLLKQFFKSKSSTATADNRTNEDPSGKLFWPDEYLTEDIPEARVWTYGYDADAIGGLFQAKNKNSVSQHGRDFAVKIEREIDNEAMRKSTVCRERTKLIVFLGTPHRGSPSAGWGEIAANLARLALQDSNKKLVETLEVNSEVLDNIHEEFKSIVHESDIRIHSFQEARGISGIKGLHNKMARCSDRADPQYRAIVGVLKQFIHSGALDGNRTIPQELPLRATHETRTAAAAAADCAPLPGYYIPFPKNTRFVGRDSTLDVLKEMLFIRRECQKVALVGLGGIGKTQVALQLAYWTKEYNHQPKYSIFWVPALSRATFEQAYTEIARKLPIQKSGEGNDGDPKRSVQQYLSSEAAGPWLLVVDNADDEDVLFGSSDAPAGMSEYLPESKGGLTLFTTRSRDVALSVAGGDVVELHEMNREEAKSVLERSLARKDLATDKMAAELLDELTRLPLAITQAAAYLNRNQVSIAEYLGLLRGTEKDIVSLMSREFRDSTRYKGSQNAIAMTWLVSFNQIRKSDSAAAELLSFIAYIEPKAIPGSILPMLESEEQMVHAIGTLCAYGFLVRRGESKIFDMHSLVHLAARIWVQIEGLAAQTMEKATRYLAAVFPSDDYDNRSLWREYLPHALRVLHRDEGVNIEEKYKLYFWAGRCLRLDGRIKEAVWCLEECSQWREGHLPEDHPSRLASQHSLAIAYRADGQMKRAIELLEHVLAIREKIFTKDHPSLLASQHELASAYLANGQITRAIELLEYVVAVRKKTLAKDHPSLLTSQHELASAYIADGQIKKAVELLEHVVAVRKKIFAKDHPSRLASQHQLASAYKSNGQTKKAIELLEHVVAVDKKIFAEDHPSRLVSEQVLAIAYRADGQIKKAVELLEHVVAVKKNIFAKDHPSQLASQHGLASAYIADGQIKKAIEQLEYVVAVGEKIYAENHPSRLASQHELAYAYQANGQTQKAIELLEHVVAAKKKIFAEDHLPDWRPSRCLQKYINRIDKWA
ncbi:hypothetical protein DL771_010654 [Monosporascus sp. 5C6A]|nr:hypothetical protein DL771_010654 [Monosporascus sp. 5C6A]